MSVFDWKIDPWRDELVAQLARVDEVAVVADRDLPVRAVDQNRLRVEQLAFARRRVAHMADRERPWQLPNSVGPSKVSAT